MADTPNTFARSGIPSLPSPAPSNSSTWASTGLPHPRGHALRPGSAKEDKVRQYVSTRISHISRRFLKYKSGETQLGDEVVGYKSMGELCKDLDELINIIWLSGTRKFARYHLGGSAIVSFVLSPLLTDCDPSKPPSPLLPQHCKRAQHVAQSLPAITEADAVDSSET